MLKILQDYVFTMGSTNHSKTELYNIATWKWEEVKSFNNSYVWFYDFASFFYDKEFYVTGGRVNIIDNDARRALVIKFNPNSENWSRVGELNFVRRGHRATVIESTVYFVGGGQKGIKSEFCQLSDGFSCTTVDRKFSDDERPLIYAYIHNRLTQVIFRLLHFMIKSLFRGF